MSMANKRSRDQPGSSSNAEQNQPPQDPPINPYLPRAYGITLTDKENKQRFRSLVLRGIEPTRYVEKRVMERLGLYNDLEVLFDNIGWRPILDGGWVTSERVVLEIMSTIEVTEAVRSQPSAVWFQCSNKACPLSAKDINRYMGCGNGGFYKAPHGFCPRAMWRQIVLPDEASFNPGYSKVTSIRNPVLRMVQRILAHSVFGRKDNTSVTTKELLVLWAMLTRTKLDFAKFFLHQAEKQSRAKSGVICLGGLWTPIATALCPEVATWSTMDVDASMNFRVLQNMNILTSIVPPFFLKQKGDDDPFPLPNEELTRVRSLFEPANFLMNSPAHLHAIAVAKGQGPVPEADNGGSDDADDLEDDSDRDEAGPSRAPHGHDYGGLEGRMANIEASVQDWDAQFIIMRQDVTSVRLTQLSMEAAQREEYARQAAYREEMLARQAQAQADNYAMREMMARFEAYQMSQGHFWPPPPPPS